MRCQPTIEDLEVLRFLNHPLHSLPSYFSIYQGEVNALKSASNIEEVQIVFTRLQNGIQKGCCSLARRMSYVALLEICDALSEGDIIMQVIMVEGYGYLRYH